MTDPDASGCSCPPAPPGGTLYVFLHGLIGVLDQPSGIDLLIPNVGAVHTYRYGEFLGEVTLQPSIAPYYLRNVNPGTARFDPQFHLVTTSAFPVCQQPNLYARIKLPTPKCIHSVLQVNLTGVIEDPGGHFANPKIATMVPVLEYTYDDPRTLLFGCDPLAVAPISYGGRIYSNLHIFAEEDLERVEDHTTAGFSAVAALFEFPCPPRLISLENVPAPTWPDSLPPGTTPLEFMSLALRTQELGYLGRTVRREILHHRPRVIVEVSPVGGNPVTCTPAISKS